MAKPLDEGSPEAVAYWLWESLRRVNDDTDTQLALYSRCRKATRGLGEFALNPKG